MSKPYAWRVLACLPILKGPACTNTSKGWQAWRCMGLYHSAMAHIIQEINDICSKDDYYRFALADKLVRQGRGFWHLLCMDGADIAAATTCGTDNCPTCECPKAELANSEDTYPYRHQGAVTLKRRLEQHWADFYERQRSRWTWQAQE